METILYKNHLIEIVRTPIAGLTDQAMANAADSTLRCIGIECGVFDASGQSYVTAEILGTQGDVIRSIRPATPDEIKEEVRSVRYNAYLAKRNADLRDRMRKEIADISNFVQTHRQQASMIPYPVQRLGMAGKTLLDFVTEAENTGGLTAQLNALRFARRLIAVYHPEVCLPSPSPYPILNRIGPDRGAGYSTANQPE